MVNAQHYIRRLWHLRNDRSALTRAVSRRLSRRFGLRDYSFRSPRIGKIALQARTGFITESLALLNDIAFSNHEDAVDAKIALADWHLGCREPLLALELLASIPRLPRDGRSFLFEARRAAGFVESNLLAIVNTPLRDSSLPIITSEAQHLGDLRCDDVSRAPRGPLVTVLVSLGDLEAGCEATLLSLANQSWPDLEVIVIGDQPRREILEIIERIHDSRIRFVATSPDGTEISPRNVGLEAALGEFITAQNPGTWAHPKRIEAQVRHHLTSPKTAITRTSHIRVTEKFVPLRHHRDDPRLIGLAGDSLMVRTDVLRSIGGWDDLVIQQDLGIEERIRSRFGTVQPIHVHPEQALTVTEEHIEPETDDRERPCVSDDVVTRASQVYTQALDVWCESTQGETGLLMRTSDDSPFPVPRILRRNHSDAEHFDVVMLSDLTLPGGTTTSNLSEIIANQRSGLKTALVHNHGRPTRRTHINTKYFSLLDERTRVLTAGERVTCDVLLVKFPPSGSRLPDVFPSVEVRRDVVIIANQTPRLSYVSDVQQMYEIDRVDDEIERKFGRRPIWTPVSPSVRDVFETHHHDALHRIRWSSDDWVEIIDVADWLRPRTPRGNERFRIGRHARDSRWKWHPDEDVLRMAYPSTDEFEIDILGGADTAIETLGGLPSNWKVRPFDSIDPADYLAQLDVFVYYPHPQLEEAFGRNILEALAAGVPVVTAPNFTSTFGDGILAVPPSEAPSILERLKDDSDYYGRISDHGMKFVAENFGHTIHINRVRRLMADC